MLTIKFGVSAGLSLALLVAGCHVQPDTTLVQERTDALFGSPPSERHSEADRVASVPTEAEVFDQPGLAVYRRFGLHHSAELHVEYERWRASLERIPQVTSLPDPVVAFGQFVETIETRTGSQDRRYSLSQTFPWFGKLALRGSVAAADAEQQWQRVRATRLRVERDIQIAYFDYAYLAQATRITGEVLELLQQLEPVVQQRIAGAGGGQQDLLRLQVEIGRVENELTSFQRVRPSLSAKLAATMHLSRRDLLPSPALTEPDATRLRADTDLLLRRAERQSPELCELAERVHENQDRLRLAGLQGWPDMTLGVDYFETGSAIAPAAGDGDDPFAFRVMFNLPIWRAKYRAAEREFEHRISAANYALSDRRVTLHADVEHAAFELDDAARQLVLYRETLLPRAREALEVTRFAYRAGRSSLLDLIDSERALLEFETGFWRACRDHYQNQARLEALIGGEL